MADFLKIEEKDDHIICMAERFDFTKRNILTIFQAVLQASRDTGKNLIFLDFTANREDTPASLKAMAGMLVEGLLLKFHGDVGRLPRIAILGVPPFISIYRPAQKIFQAVGMPVAVFTDEEEAKIWLFQEMNTSPTT